MLCKRVTHRFVAIEMQELRVVSLDVLKRRSKKYRSQNTKYYLFNAIKTIPTTFL